MKRIISISLLTLVLLASSRMSMSAHYCGGELVSLEFFKSKKGCNKCGSIEKNHACCKDVTNNITSEDFHNKTVNFEFNQSIVALPVTENSFSIISFDIPQLNRNVIQDNAPPFFIKEPFYILFRSLII